MTPESAFGIAIILAISFVYFSLDYRIEKLEDDMYEINETHKRKLCGDCCHKKTCKIKKYVKYGSVCINKLTETECLRNPNGKPVRF
jgi:hypothetical protein